MNAVASARSITWGDLRILLPDRQITPLGRQKAWSESMKAVLQSRTQTECVLLVASIFALSVCLIGRPVMLTAAEASPTTTKESSKEASKDKDEDGDADSKDVKKGEKKEE